MDPPRSAVIAVLAHDAVRLPNGVVLAEPQSAAPFADVAEATSARIGRRCVRFDGPAGSLSVRVSRWWRPRPPRPLTRDDAAAATRAAARLRDALTGVTGGLPAEATAPLHTALDGADRAERACAGLIGLGPGLTPSGDDAVCGFLLAVRHLGGPSLCRPLADAALARAATATTALSASLIAHAARGESCPEATDLLDAAAGHGPVGPALAALRAIGHTSGTDLALGVLAGALAVSRTRPGPSGAADSTQQTRSTRDH
ncbi:hypothetical protein HDA32_001223 [Spinactinospora alkalitolerans]|uniref:DUF2877 domain-containing protein n=1 Tax=Spinactinospora alkalitolerans TaxID=687207 RepID=A0A852TTM6_9ACTN|nr:DUF2877 domain-containing protein [Spinactinospora alkalitolerans]NYE46103.1 hypothetical protein [Spinactinospora alkalitolerans]